MLKIRDSEATIMNFKKSGLTLPTVFLAAFWASNTHALLIDSFDTGVSVGVTTAAPDSSAGATGDSGAGMVGARVLTVNKTAGAAGGANGA
jgi:hypothetical protein